MSRARTSTRTRFRSCAAATARPCCSAGWRSATATPGSPRRCRSATWTARGATNGCCSPRSRTRSSLRPGMLRLAQYLGTLRVLPREGPPVQVFVVAPRAQRSTFEQALVSDARLVFHTVDEGEALRSVGVRRAPERILGEALYLHLAAKKPPREQFASSAERRRYQVWQLQRGIVAAGALGFAACALYAGVQWVDALQVGGRAASQQRD